MCSFCNILHLLNDEGHLLPSGIVPFHGFSMYSKYIVKPVCCVIFSFMSSNLFPHTRSLSAVLHLWQIWSLVRSLQGNVHQVSIVHWHSYPGLWDGSLLLKLSLLPSFLSRVMPFVILFLSSQVFCSPPLHLVPFRGQFYRVVQLKNASV